MSRIYFHSPSETREIYGRERAWMGVLTEGTALGVLGIDRFGADRYLKALPLDAYPHRSRKGWDDRGTGSAILLADSLRTWISGIGQNRWRVDGEDYDCWQLNLNTCLAIGNDALKLCARLHAQCEIHCWIDGTNRSWLAGLVRQGVQCGVMRDAGYPRRDGPPEPPETWYGRRQWSDLADWLESRSDEPVVCSYSVCAQFPNRSATTWVQPDDDPDGDSWYDLDAEQQWAMGMDWLRQHAPELSPVGWNEYRFGHFKDAFWLMDRV